MGRDVLPNRCCCNGLLGRPNIQGSRIGRQQRCSPRQKRPSEQGPVAAGDRLASGGQVLSADE